MRIILHNPQKINFFGKTVQDWITGGKVSSKLGYFQKYISKGKVIIYCDDSGSSLPVSFLRRSYVISKIINYIEIYLWLLINKLNPFKVEIFFDSRKIRKSDTLFSITHTYLDNENEGTQALINLDCIKMFYMSHYMFSSSIISKNVKKGKSIFLVAENNLWKNSMFFKKYFPDYCKDVYVLPFSYQGRFKKSSPFLLRKNKCLAIGSVQTINIFNDSSRDMYDYFRVDTLHPMRKAIYINRSEIADYIDSCISHINEDTNQALSKLKNPSGNLLKKIYLKIRNYYISNVLGSYTRRAYYDFDIVKKYNEYRMFVVPEEIADLPGIGFVEGMACGCAYIGIKSNMYRDIGLVDGVHYIAYGNTLNSLVDAVKYYQNHNDELAHIAENGYNFVINNFSNEIVANRFLEDLETFSQNTRNSSKINGSLLQSSFVFK